jgi:hypothetical protein
VDSHHAKKLVLHICFALRACTANLKLHGRHALTTERLTFFGSIVEHRVGLLTAEGILLLLDCCGTAAC